MLAALALVVAGCSTPGSGIQAGEHVTIYVSMPLRGAEAVEGRDVVGGAKLALADAHGKVGELAVRAVYLDDTAGRGARARWSPAVAAANARQASEDSTAIAYLGDFDSGASRFSVPITNEARMLQISPASGAVDLVQPFLGAGDQLPEDVQPTGERTFGRVIPSDAVQAEAAAVLGEAAWRPQRRRAVGRVAVRRHDGHGIQAGGKWPAPHRTAPGGPPVLRRHGRRRSPAGQASGLPVLADHTDRLRRDVRSGSLSPDPRGGLQLSADPGRRGRAARRARDLCRAGPGAAAGPPAGGSCAPSTARYGLEPGRYAAYGYEAMAVALDSIRRAGDKGDDRDSVVDAFFDTQDRASVLGTYSIDEVGDTTLTALAGYRVSDGRPVFANPLRVP